MDWQLQAAKQRFSELVRRTLDEGPQVVTRHGKPAVVVVAADEFHRLRRGRRGFKDVLLSAPPMDDSGIVRDRRPARTVELASDLRERGR